MRKDSSKNLLYLPKKNSIAKKTDKAYKTLAKAKLVIGSNQTNDSGVTNPSQKQSDSTHKNSENKSDGI